MSGGRSGARDLAARALALRWLLLDVDGVLTDGRLWFGAEGESLKAFHVRDGMAIRLAQRAGLAVGLLSGRSSAVVERRALDLGLDAVILGHEDKRESFAAFLAERGLEPEQVAYVGDDLPDLPVIAACGVSFAPADAAAEVRERAEFILSARGGEGAVREAVENLLRWRGAWASVLDAFRPGPE
ncbi:MAG: HAD family hydrolase [Thermoanaerobaculia bacterium]|nr:MAG: HAD family hydrolase [Thermoanaerobaculia bacterium]